MLTSSVRSLVSAGMAWRFGVKVSSPAYVFTLAGSEENVAWICSELGAELLPADCDEAWGVGGSLSAALPAFSKEAVQRAIAACRGEVYVRGQLAADLEVRLAFR